MDVPPLFAIWNEGAIVHWRLTAIAADVYTRVSYCWSTPDVVAARVTGLLHERFADRARRVAISLGGPHRNEAVVSCMTRDSLTHAVTHACVDHAFAHRYICTYRPARFGVPHVRR